MVADGEMSGKGNLLSGYLGLRVGKVPLVHGVDMSITYNGRKKLKGNYCL